MLRVKVVGNSWHVIKGLYHHDDCICSSTKFSLIVIRFGYSCEATTGLHHHDVCHIGTRSSATTVLTQNWPHVTLCYINLILHWAKHITLWSLTNSLGPSGAIWRQRSGSTLPQVMACCLTAPSHYLNQCWLISKVEWHSSKGMITRDTSTINHWNYLEN